MSTKDISELLNIGLEYFRGGRLQEAWRTLSEVIDVDPQNFMAIRLMGVIAAQSGNLNIAVELTKSAIEINPKDASAKLDFANMLVSLGETTEAIRQYDESLGLDPDNHLAHYNKGILLRDLGLNKDAVNCFQSAIIKNPNYAGSRLNKGLLELDLGNFEQAIYSQKSGLSLFPSDKDQLHTLARSYEAQGTLEEARKFYLRSICAVNDYVPALIGFSNFLNNLNDESASHYALSAIILNPGEARAYVNLGISRHHKQLFSDALWSHECAVRIDRSLPEGHMNRGNALLELARFEEAILSHDSAIALKQDFAEAYWNKSMALLLLGRLSDGFALYDWRLRGKDNIYDNIYSNIQEYVGQEVNNKSILLYPEQGQGDIIQFARYASILAEKGANVVLEVYPQLERLFSTFDKNIKVVSSKDIIPNTDFICPLLNLPHLLETTLETVPWRGPYLSALSNNKIPVIEGKKPRIGVVWRGNPQHKNDRNRSINLDIFEQLLELPFTFVALQKGISEYDSVKLKYLNNVQTVEDEIRDFADTASFIEALDLVITVDTSVAHLAGALGKEVWILLPFTPDYRWMLQRTDTPWYPSARLYRQDESRVWDPLLKQVIADLTKRFLNA